MHTLMLLHAIMHTKTFHTYITQEWKFSTVQTKMFLEIILHIKGFLTQMT